MTQHGSLLAPTALRLLPDPRRLCCLPQLAKNVSVNPAGASLQVSNGGACAGSREASRESTDRRMRAVRRRQPTHAAPGLTPWHATQTACASRTTWRSSGPTCASPTTSTCPRRTSTAPPSTARAVRPAPACGQTPSVWQRAAGPGGAPRGGSRVGGATAHWPRPHARCNVPLARPIRLASAQRPAGPRDPRLDTHGWARSMHGAGAGDAQAGRRPFLILKADSAADARAQTTTRWTWRRPTTWTTTPTSRSGALTPAPAQCAAATRSTKF